MLQESQDLCAEADELKRFLETLAAEDWERTTGFMSWTPWDVVAHLHFFDEVSLVALEGRDAFAQKRDELIGAGPATLRLWCIIIECAGGITVSTAPCQRGV